MRKHLLGLVLFVVTFTLGAVTGPRARGFEVIGGRYSDVCGAQTFVTDRGERVTFWSCSVFHGDASALDDLDARSAYYNVISRTGFRTLGSYFTGDRTGYCVLRLDEGRRNDICSLSLEAVLEFEKKYFDGDR